MTSPAAMAASELVAGTTRGSRRALARLLTLVESGGGAARDAFAASSRRPPTVGFVGITGAPGAGKSNAGFDELRGMVLEELAGRADALCAGPNFDTVVAEVARGASDPYTAAAEFLPGTGPPAAGTEQA